MVALRKESVDRKSCGDTLRPPALVALRKESVDRKVIAGTASAKGHSSLSARRAWIEKLKQLLLKTLKAVALRKESVDRKTKTVALEDPESGRSPQGERG